MDPFEIYNFVPFKFCTPKKMFPNFRTLKIFTFLTVCLIRFLYSKIKNILFKYIDDDLYSHFLSVDELVHISSLFGFIKPKKSITIHEQKLKLLQILDIKVVLKFHKKVAFIFFYFVKSTNFFSIKKYIYFLQSMIYNVIITAN